MQALTESMDFMKNVREDIILNSGRLSLIVSIVYPLLPSSMRRSSACMEDYHQN